MTKNNKIAFYSYKGGTGRTLALANVASYLVRFGFKVCIVDMDLEAPGIHYKFMSPNDTRHSNMKGVVDYVDFFANKMYSPPDSEFDDYLLHIDENISIMPSGNVNSEAYWEKLANLDWHELLFRDHSDGPRMLSDLFGRIEKHSKGYDYILVDARTGITPVSTLCAAVFCDVLTAFFTPSMESLHGTKQVLCRIRNMREKHELPPMRIISIMTRYEEFDNPDEPDAESKFIAEKQSLLSDEGKSLFDDFYVIHSDREIERHEKIVWDNESSSDDNDTYLYMQLRSEYLKFFTSLVDGIAIEERAQSMIDKIMNNKNLIDNPDGIQRDVATLAEALQNKVIWHALIKIYDLRHIDKLNVHMYVNAINMFYETGGHCDAVDKRYMDVFIECANDEYGAPVDYYMNYFEAQKLLCIARKLPSSEKYAFASILAHSNEHRDQAFDMLLTLMEDSEYGVHALKRILELFLESESLYRDNEHLLPSISEIKQQQYFTNEFLEAAYNVYLMYLLDSHAQELLDDDMAYNYLCNDPFRLMKVYNVVAPDKLEQLIERECLPLVRQEDYAGLRRFVNEADKHGLLDIVIAVLPTSDAFVIDVLKERNRSRARRRPIRPA